jgi:hypothetical protein
VHLPAGKGTWRESKKSVHGKTEGNAAANGKRGLVLEVGSGEYDFRAG